MNNSQLRKLGVPDICLKSALGAVQTLAKKRKLRGRALKDRIRDVLDEPLKYRDDEDLGAFARDIIEDREFSRPEPISYRTWGDDIEAGAHQQMRASCSLPMAVGAALMPDAHVGYGLPIGGVLALENAVVPYAVGVDIACRMKLSVLDLPVDALGAEFHRFKHALEGGTRFGIGSCYQRPQQHAVMDEDWTITKVTRENKDKAWKQLGSSGSGNHFVEFGLFTLPERDEELGLEPGSYVALLSHSGSRGTGASVCSVYSSIARARLPKRYEDVTRLAWLSLDSQEGQEYWAAMNLMGDYASANHDVIHRQVSALLGAEMISSVENHHNFAWKETHAGKEVIVHRKGATPAGEGVLGVIPGSMDSPAYIVRGKGNPESLDSASHGAGRCMSRREAKDTFNFARVKKELAKKGVTILSAGADEVPGVYKDIDEVMAAQQDLVEVVARFDPKIVKMCGDGSRAED